MRILNRKEFLAIPERVVFAKYSPMCCENLSVKIGQYRHNDFTYQLLSPEGIVDCHDSNGLYEKLSAAEDDSSLELEANFECSGRDGLLDDDQLFMVLSKSDVIGLVNALLGTLK